MHSCFYYISLAGFNLGTYYTQLGSAASFPELRAQFQSRLPFSDSQIRIESVLFQKQAGKTSNGCPASKFVSRCKKHEGEIFIFDLSKFQ